MINNKTNENMEKKIYQQPLMQNRAPWANLPIAQMPVGSDEHEDQWSKERGDDLDFDPSIEQGEEYGSLW